MTRSDARFLVQADAMPQLVWTTDSQGNHLYYNRRWYDYTGQTVEESMGFGFALALHPDDRARTLARWRRAWEGGEDYEIEYRFRRHDGVYRWFVGRAEPVRDPETGAVTMWVGSCTDIQSRVEAEAKSRHAIRVLDTISDAHLTLDRDFCITYVNAEAARINKKPASEFIGRLHWDEWPASIGTEFERQFRRAMAERVTVRFLENYHVAGEYDDWIDVTAYPADEEDGGGIHLVYRDVTERIQRERREQFLAELAERARTLTDPESVIVDAVRSLGEFLGVSRCVFYDVDLEADIITVRPDYRADDSVVSIAGTLPMSAFGPALAAELKAGRHFVVDDVRDSVGQVPPEYVDAYDSIGIRALAVVPAVYSDRLVSGIGVHCSMPRRWKTDEVELL